MMASARLPVYISWMGEQNQVSEMQNIALKGMNGISAKQQYKAWNLNQSSKSKSIQKKRRRWKRRNKIELIE